MSLYSWDIILMYIAGLITKVAIQLIPKPLQVTVLLIHIHHYQHALRVMSLSKKYWYDVLTAIEYMDSCSMSMICKHHKSLANK